MRLKVDAGLFWLSNIYRYMITKFTTHYYCSLSKKLHLITTYDISSLHHSDATTLVHYWKNLIYLPMTLHRYVTCIPRYMITKSTICYLFTMIFSHYIICLLNREWRGIVVIFHHYITQMLLHGSLFNKINQFSHDISSLCHMQGMT